MKSLIKLLCLCVMLTSIFVLSSFAKTKRRNTLLTKYEKTKIVGESAKSNSKKEFKKCSVPAKVNKIKFSAEEEGIVECVAALSDVADGTAIYLYAVARYGANSAAAKEAKAQLDKDVAKVAYQCNPLAS